MTDDPNGINDGEDGGNSDPPPPPPPPPCEFSIEGPAFLAVGESATYTLSIGGADEIMWAEPAGPLQSDSPTLTEPTLEVTAQDTPGTATLAALVTVDGETCMDELEVAVVRPRLASATFGGPRHDVVQDTGEAYDPPHWLDDDLDGDGEDEGDRRSPIASTRGGTVVIDEVRFSIEPAAADLPETPVFGAGPDGQFFMGMGSMVGDELFVSNPMTAEAALPNTVRFYDPYVIDWELALDEEGDTFTPVGSSDNRVYVTLDDPAPVAPLLPQGSEALLYETVIDITVRNADGLADEQAVVAAIYSDFTDRSVARKAMDGLNDEDGAMMRYWLEAGDPLTGVIIQQCQGMGTMVSPEDPMDNPELQTVGTCTAWADLLKNALGTHGLAGVKRLRVFSAYGPGSVSLLVRDWQFDAQGSLAPYCPEFPFIGPFDPRFDGPELPQFNELEDLPGVPGQGAVANPPSVFNLHWIVGKDGAVLDGQWIGGVLYDPSYGTGPFASHITWENASIGGHTFECAVPDDANLPAEFLELLPPIEGGFLVDPASAIDSQGVLETWFISSD